ncbi:30S ribosomal protein S18 [Candidatus Azambacteria bacterium]|nr:30S ribosomal protein S18 [Candidatus Azambacteria bacterium]
METKNQKPLNQKNICYFCAQNIQDVDYKNTEILRHFISAQAKIMPRRRSHLCAKHQRKLATAVKRARTMALLSFTAR